MNKNNILIESFYEFKRVRRSVLFRVFILLSIFGVIVYQFTFLSREVSSISIKELFRFYMDWPSQALSSAIAFKSAYYFNIIQLLLVACFAVNGSSASVASTRGALDARPQDNSEIVIGNILGKLYAFTLLNWLSFGTSIVLNLVLNPRSFELSNYFFYWATLTLPALIYFLGISSLVARSIRHQGVSLVFLLLFMGGITFLGAGFLNGLFDPCARYIPNMFSDFTGHVNLNNYLLQRGSILLVGFGFVVLSIIPYPRIPNGSLVVRRSVLVACIPFLLSYVLAFVYHARHEAIGDVREAYKRVYLEYGQPSKARIEQHDLHLKELSNGDISVNSRMKVINKTSSTLPLVLYLNPGLKVKSVAIDGVAASFRREHQAIVFDEELSSGEAREVSIDYEGGIENGLCFLDVPAEEYDSPTVNSHGIYHHGYTPAFCGKEYKLLTPECVWYPVCVPPYNPSGVREVNFTRYSLTVEHDPQLKAISQGDIVEEGEGWTSFSFNFDIPGISLCVGNYEKRSITVERIRIDMYYLSDHEYLLDRYDFSRDKLADQLENTKRLFEGVHGLEPSFEATSEELKIIDAMKDGKREVSELYKEVLGRRPFDPTKSYPYPWLNLVEVPCEFDCFPGFLRPTGEREQDGMVFIPEKLHTVKKYETTPPCDEEEKDAILSTFRLSVIEPILGKGGCNILPAFRGRTYFISSTKYPNFHHVFVNILFAGIKLTSSGDDDPRAIEYLGRNSLRNAFLDNSLSTDELKSIVDKKSMELHLNILSHLKQGDLYMFYMRFLEDNVLKETTDEECFRQFHQILGLRVDSLVERWYNTDRLPIFDIRDARAIILGPTDQPMIADVLYSFSVFNRGDVPGLIMTNDGQSWVISAREAKQVRARKRKDSPIRTDRSSIDIPLAQNFPSSLFLENEEPGGSIVDTTTGAFIIDTLAFRASTDEIIVDNEDPGFRIVKAKGFNIVSLFHDEKKRLRQYYNRGLQPDSWLLAIDVDFYGFPVQNAYYKKASSGKLKVEWNAQLPREGKYEVFYYNVKPYSPIFDPKREFHYVVFDGKEEHEVISFVNADEVGWISLGIFDFTTKAKVTLSDRDRKDKIVTQYGCFPQEIIADAVKWVPVKE